MPKYKLTQKTDANGTTQDIVLDASSVDLSNYVQSSRTINSKALSSNITLSASDVKALPNYSLSISTGAGNPREVKFVRVNYSTFDGNNAGYFRIGAMCSHGNGSSYTFLEDIIIGVSATPSVTCTIYKQVQNTSTYTIDGHSVHFGDVYWVVDTTNQCVDFYIIGGQYATLMFTPFMRIGNTISDTSKIVQYTSANYYSSGTRVWDATGNGSLYARTSDIPSLSGYLQGSKYNANNPSTFIGYTAGENANSEYQVAFNGNNDANGICWSKFGNISNSVKSPSACTYNGFFYVSSTNASLSGADSNPFTASGLHTSSNDFRILTTAYSDQWLQQVATDFRSDYVFVRRRENGTWQDWVRVAPASAPSNVVTTDTAQTISGAKTFSGTTTFPNNAKIDTNGDVTGRYLTGTWLKTTGATEIGNSWTDVFVNDGNGWLYKRSKANFKSDLGIPTNVPKFIYVGTYTSQTYVSAMSMEQGYTYLIVPANNSSPCIYITNNSGTNVYASGCPIVVRRYYSLSKQRVYVTLPNGDSTNYQTGDLRMTNVSVYKIIES